MLQSPERKTPVPVDAMAMLRQAASTFPQTPSIIRHIPLTDPELIEVFHQEYVLLPAAFIVWLLPSNCFTFMG